MTTSGLAALILPSVAFAGSTNVTRLVAGPGAPVSHGLGTGNTQHPGRLPFTGVNLAFFAPAGLPLICVGILLNRAAWRGPNEHK
jgi:hypothetical protein